VVFGFAYAIVDPHSRIAHRLNPLLGKPDACMKYHFFTGIFLQLATKLDLLAYHELLDECRYFYNNKKSAKSSKIFAARKQNAVSPAPTVTKHILSCHRAGYKILYIIILCDFRNQHNHLIHIFIQTRRFQFVLDYRNIKPSF
jgi:hypothetical protein